MGGQQAKELRDQPGEKIADKEPVETDQTAVCDSPPTSKDSEHDEKVKKQDEECENTQKQNEGKATVQRKASILKKGKGFLNTLPRPRFRNPAKTTKTPKPDPAVEQTDDSQVAQNADELTEVHHLEENKTEDKQDVCGTKSKYSLLKLFLSLLSVPKIIVRDLIVEIVVQLLYSCIRDSVCFCGEKFVGLCKGIYRFLGMRKEYIITIILLVIISWLLYSIKSDLRNVSSEQSKARKENTKILSELDKLSETASETLAIVHETHKTLIMNKEGNAYSIPDTGAQTDETSSSGIASFVQEKGKAFLIHNCHLF